MNTTTEERASQLEISLQKAVTLPLMQQYRILKALDSSLGDQFLNAISQYDQATATILQELPVYEQSCSLVSTQGLGTDVARSKLLILWRSGTDSLTVSSVWGALVNAPTRNTLLISLAPEFHRALSDAEPRVIHCMTQLATTWLRPRLPDEPRGELYKRIAALRPAEQNKQLHELMDKNNEGTITPAEYAELVRLNQFFDTLQAIIDDAITSTRQKPS